MNVIVCVGRYLRAAAAVAGLLFAAQTAAQPVTIAKDGPLYAEPRFGAAVAAQVKDGTAGEATTKQTPWVNVKTANGTGWILSVNVRYAQGASASPAPARTASTQRVGGTSTLGIRGFDPVDLAKGQTDQQQLKQLNDYAASAADAASAAQSTGLSAARLEYF